MTAMERFIAYAGDFEASYGDDDWERIKPHFADDAVYAVESKAFGSTMKGPDAIVAGLKKSLDGFDRRFDTRKIDVVDGPTAEGDEVRASWTVTYTKQGCDDYVLVGRSTVRIEDDRIVNLTDHYEPEADEYLKQWRAKNEVDVDPSYT